MPRGGVHVGAGQRGTARGDRAEPRQLGQPDRGVDVGQVELAARHLDVHAIDAAADHALQPQPLGAQRLVLVVHHQAAAFDRRDVLVGLEAEADQVAETADAPAAPARVDRLRGVLDHAQAVLLGDRVETVHVDRQAGQIDRQDCAGAGRDRGLDRVEIEVAGARIDVDEDRARPDRDDHVGGGDPGDRGGNDLVAGTDAGDPQRDLHRRRAIGQRAHRPAVEQRRQRGLEGLHLRAGGDPARGQHFADRRDRVRVDVGPDEGQEGFGGSGGSGHRANRQGRRRGSVARNGGGQEQEGQERAIRNTPARISRMPAIRNGPIISPNSHHAATALTT